MVVGILVSGSMETILLFESYEISLKGNFGFLGLIQKFIFYFPTTSKIVLLWVGINMESAFSIFAKTRDLCELGRR